MSDINGRGNYAGISHNANATITLNRFNYVNQFLIVWNVNGIYRM